MLSGLVKFSDDPDDDPELMTSFPVFGYISRSNHRSDFRLTPLDSSASSGSDRLGPVR